MRGGGLSTVLATVGILTICGAAVAQEEAPDGGLRLDVGGYGSFRWEASDADEVPASFTLRRFVVTTDARWGERLRVYSEVEYERLSEIGVERAAEAEDGGLALEQELEGSNGSEIALEQAWGQFDLTRSIGLRFGAVLPPVGRFNARHDDNLWDFPRRPLADREGGALPVEAAWTELGLGIVGRADVGEVPIAWEAYVLNGVALDFAIEHKLLTRDPAPDKLEAEAAVRPAAGSFDGSNPADAFAGRISVSPALGSEYGISAYVGEYTPEWLTASATARTLGVDGRQRLGPLVLEGELLRTTWGDLDAVLADVARVAGDRAAETSDPGLETEVAIEVAGLSDARTGFWLDLEWPIALPRGLWGLDDAVLTPVVRVEGVRWEGNVEELDFAGGAVTALNRADRSQRRWSAGLAFRPVPQAVFHLVYERNDAVDGALIDPAVAEGSTNAVTFGMAVGF